MTRLRLLILALFLSGSAFGQITNYVIFNFSDFTTQPQRVRSFKLIPYGTPYTNNSGTIVTRDVRFGSTGTNGSLSISNVYPGGYRSELTGTTASTTNYFVFPLTNSPTAFLNAADWTTNSGMVFNFQTAYSQAQADARFLKKAGDDGRNLTNVTTEIGLLHAPITGPGKSAPGYNPASQPSTNSYLAGAGVVRAIYAQPDVSGSADYTKYNFRIWTDFGVNAASPPAGNLVFDVPVPLLLGSKFRFPTNGDYEVVRNSAFINSLDVSTNALFGGYVRHFELTMNMPFTNGFYARFWDTNANDYAGSGYMQIYAETGAVAFAYGNYRLHGKTILGLNNGYGKTNTASITTNIAGPGMMVGVMGAFNGWNYGPAPAVVNFTNATTLSSVASNLFVATSAGFSTNDVVVISAPAYGSQAATNRTMKISGLSNGTNIIVTNVFGFTNTIGASVTMTVDQSVTDGFASANAGYFDTVTPIWTNATGAVYVPSGGDDFWFNTYSLVSGAFMGYDFGTINAFYEPPDYRRMWFETYRWLKDRPFTWTGTMTFLMPPNVLQEADYTLFYYAP